MTAATKLPDDLQIVETYLYECKTKKRGAYARTARRYNCSDQHVSNVVRHHRQAAPAPAEAADLYNPDTGAYQQEQAAQLAAWRAERQQAKQAALLCRLMAEEAPTGDDLTNDANSASQSPVGIVLDFDYQPESQRYELAIERPGYRAPVANRNGYAWLMSGFATLLTVCLLVISSVHFLLGLSMLPSVLGLWWCFGEARRVTYFL